MQISLLIEINSILNLFWSCQFSSRSVSQNEKVEKNTEQWDHEVAAQLLFEVANTVTQNVCHLKFDFRKKFTKPAVACKLACLKPEINF